MVVFYSRTYIPFTMMVTVLKDFTGIFLLEYANLVGNKHKVNFVHREPL